jgi:hypothetical protein
MVGDAKAVDAEGIEMDSLRIYPIDGVLAANASASSALDDASRESSSEASRSTHEPTRETRDTAIPGDSQPGRTRDTPRVDPAAPPGGQPPRQ